MGQQTCVALSAVFPLLLVTMAIEHRRVIRDVHRHKGIFNWIVESSMFAAIIGLILSIIGVEGDGLTALLATICWIAFGWATFVLLGVLLWIVLQDREDHEAALERERLAAEQKRLADEREALALRRRSRVWWRRSRRPLR